MNLDDIHREVESLKQTMNTVLEAVARDHNLLMEHDKILVRGNGTPSLQEVVRSLSENLSRFILSYEKERAEMKLKTEQEEKDKKDERTKWKWTLIAVGLPISITFLGQALVFWVRIAPLIEKLNVSN